MAKTSLTISFAVAILLGAGCLKTEVSIPQKPLFDPIVETSALSKDGLVASLPTSKFSTIEVIAGSTDQLYTNTTYDFKIRAPKTWELTEYTGVDARPDGGRDTSRELRAVALDPQKTFTQEEFDTLDFMPGLITIRINYATGLPPNVTPATINLSGTTQAVYYRTTISDQSPNPAWFNTVDDIYKIIIPKQYNYIAPLQIEVVYRQNQAKDKALLKQIDSIIRSFELLP